MVQPRMRAGDADRTRAVEQLGRHLGVGRLDVPEFDDRVFLAHAAIYLERPIHRPDRVVRAAVPLVLALLAAWSAVALVHGAPPFLGSCCSSSSSSSADGAARW